MSDPVEDLLFDAAWSGSVDDLSSLLRDRPDVNVNWTNPDKYQWTPLHAASLRGRVEVAKLLLAHPNIHVNLKSKFGETPFLLGCQISCVVALLLKDPRVDVTLEDNKGCTPLWYASSSGKLDVIEWLIASGRDLGDIENKKGRWRGKDYTP